MISAEMLEKFRKETLKLTQEQLEKKSGISQSYISQIEKGHKIASRNYVDRITSFCKLPTLHRRILYVYIKEDLIDKWILKNEEKWTEDY